MQHSLCAAQLHSQGSTPRRETMDGRKEGVVGNNMGAAALVIVGVLLSILGLFNGNIPLIVIGVVALIAAGTLQAVGTRRS